MNLSSAVNSLPCQILELLVNEEGRGERVFLGGCLGLHSGASWAGVSAVAEQAVGGLSGSSQEEAKIALALSRMAPAPCTACALVPSLWDTRLFHTLHLLRPTLSSNRCTSRPKSCPAATRVCHASPVARPLWPAAAMSPASGSARTPSSPLSPLQWW